MLTIFSGRGQEEEIGLHSCAAEEGADGVQVVVGERPCGSGFLDVGDRGERTRQHISMRAKEWTRSCARLPR